MARKDLIKYYKEQQAVYFEMLETMKEYELALKNEVIDQERYDYIVEKSQLMKDNYERISYIMFLLNAPKNNKKRPSFYKVNKEYFDYLNSKSTDNTLEKDTDFLKEFKKYVKEMKKHD